MSNPSNLYAEKIYSEHPLALWALDDQADYISLISEGQRNIQSLWNNSGATIVSGSGSNAPIAPFLSSISTSISGNVPSGPTAEIVSISPDIINFQSLNSTFGTFCIGTYFYSTSSLITSIAIGYEYTDTTSAQIVQKFETFNEPITSNWTFISGTFEIPDENTTFRILLKVTTASGGTSQDDYKLYINGISLGQWSEEFNVNSLGLTPEAFPSDIGLDTESLVIQADAYGLAEDTGYYFVDNNFLVGRNTSIPLVFGASGVTKLLPNSNNLPSLIVPGKGFLNNSGRYQDYTVEFWARINSDASTPKRIFGPISSLDGLYVEGGFLTLKIGNSFRSHFVGEWFRPMLIHIRVIENSASLLINGEEVLSFVIDTESLDLPEISSSLGSLDWLGFYSYQDIAPLEIDCIAIYPYQVPITVAKRRWVYGQGVLSPEGINSSYGGTTAFIDFPFAEYTANYSYPDFAQWQQANFDNLVTTSSSLKTPEYSLPTIFLNSKSVDSLYQDSLSLQSGTHSFITFRPNSSWDSEHCYFNFNKFNITSGQVKSIYAVVSTNDISTVPGSQPQTLIKIYSENSSDYFLIKQQEDEVIYLLNYGGEDQILKTTPVIESGQLFSVGINIDLLSSSYGENVASFFGNQNFLKLYFAGDQDPDNTFTGNIYTLGFCTTFNYEEISSNYDEDGFVIFDDLSIVNATEEISTALIEHTASYTLLPTEAYGSIFLDIGTSGHWEDYLPLSYFAQYVQNDIGNEFYDLDFLQFNVGYPSPSRVIESDQELESWTYGELKNEYSSPTQKTYEQLDNFLFTGWNEYDDMTTKTEKVYEYDTEDASVRSYITFQYIEDGANARQSSFTRLGKARQGKLIDIDDHPLWSTTKFEVVDNTVIYPTKSVNFNNLAIVYRLEFKSRSTISKPLSLKHLSFASQVFNDNSFNPVGTRFGTQIFPYTRSGLYYDYKSKNPFSIYKGSTPYLYMTRNSGIELKGKFDPLTDRGLSIPINSQLANNYKINAIQLWHRYDESRFPGSATQLFEIDHKGEKIQFFIVTNNDLGNRARVFAINADTGQPYNGVTYFLNGKLVREPVLTVKEWSVIGLRFSNSLNFDSYIGAINLNGLGVFNNISYYQSTDLQQVQKTVTRPWLKVKSDGLIDFEWQYWLDNYLWEGMLSISTSEIYGVSPENIYKAYTGTNKIIIDDENGLSIDADALRIYNAVSWSSETVSPV
jgi:hypothetical protein